MMAEKKIVIDINEEGTLHAETFGMQGTECIAELDKLMKNIARHGRSTKKPEYFKEGVATDNTIKVNQK